MALSPGDGLLLEKVAYEKYNELTTTHSPIMITQISTKAEVIDFRNEIARFIASREIKDKAFTRWLSWFDDNRDNHYIDFEPTVKNLPEATLKGCCCSWCQKKRESKLSEATRKGCCCSWCEKKRLNN